jgi:UDP-N-acetylmuramoyl-tripeptide--D-alanyl-D-alanine ligase
MYNSLMFRTQFKKMIIALLTWEARRALSRWKPFIILVSGSVGKTTTKDAIYHVLKNTGHVRRSEKSFNSEIGVPLTILGIPNAWSNPFLWLKNLLVGFFVVYGKSYPKVLILEVGSDHPGDIAELLTWVSPHIAVVTCLPEVPVHVEYFLSPTAIREEDALVLHALQSDGIAILNGDDPHTDALKGGLRARGRRVIAYGFAKDAEVRGDNLTIKNVESDEYVHPVGLTFGVTVGEAHEEVTLSGVLGSQVSTAVLGALSVGIARGLSLKEMSASLSDFMSPPGRMRLIPGKNKSTIIDDTYNASPVALAKALETLKMTTGARKIAILGDMLELGNYSNAEHERAGQMAGTFLDILITVGSRAKKIAESAEAKGLPREKIHVCDTAIDAGEYLLPLLSCGDIVLLKGSQGSGANMIRLERAVKILMAHPDDARELLVRQDASWQTH